MFMKTDQETDVLAATKVLNPQIALRTTCDLCDAKHFYIVAIRFEQCPGILIQPSIVVSGSQLPEMFSQAAESLG